MLTSKDVENSISKETYLIIAFKTTSMAYYMEKLRKEESLDGRLIPLPKVISAGCGVAFATKIFNKDYWIDYMQTKKVEYESIRIIDL